MSMRSGIPDYDAPAYDDAVLKTGNLTHSPYEVRACGLPNCHSNPGTLTQALSLPITFSPNSFVFLLSSYGNLISFMKALRSVGVGGFVCPPGNCTSYSSTNYILLGVLLLQHAPETQKTWTTYDQGLGAGINMSMFPTLKFLTTGSMDKQGTR